MKLVVTPAEAARPLAGETFTVEVDYSGVPEEFTDPDTSIEGWIRACYPLAPVQTCDGSFVVNEPMGAQTWFPSNNYPTDKASFDTLDHGPEHARRARGRRGRGTDRQRRRDDDLALARGRPDRDLPDHGDGRRVHLHGRARWSRPRPRARWRSTTRSTPRRTRCRSTRSTPRSTRRRRRSTSSATLYGPYPFDSTGSGRRPRLGCRLRARGADQAPVLGRLYERQPRDRHRHPAARALPPVVRQQRHARSLERHLVQRGLGELVGVVLAVPRERGRRPGGDLRRPLRRHPGRGLGDRPGRPRRRPGQSVRVLPHLPAGRDDPAGLPRDRRRRDLLRARRRAARASSATAT